jgi:SPASM domain peptide maturase of grasp-with-spasm system
MKLVKFENCIPVRGATRSTICDLQRNDLKLIPNSLQEILELHIGKSLNQIKEAYKNEFDEIIDEYIDFLIDNEFAFLTENIDWFPPISNNWDFSSNLTNAILDIDTNSNYLYENILNQLSTFSCSSIQIRFFKSIDLNKLAEILIYLDEIKSSIISVEVLIKFSKSTNENELVKLINSFSRLMRVTIYSSKEEKLIQSKIQDQASINFITQDIISEKSCGVVSKNYFTVNMSMFTESINHNSCLNRKISIDVNGNIKNCPSMPESYGNIKDTTLEEALNKPGFKKYWNVTKDMIDVCKDCEFRYVCTDCRAYTERTTFDKDEIDLSKPLKCGYNPYTNEWAEWSTNPLKQKAIEYYGMQEMVKKDA